MQHAWVAPRPGRFLAFAWFIESVTSPVYIALRLVSGAVSATERWVVVIDPAVSPEELADSRGELHRVDRRARGRYIGAQVSTGLLYAWPLVMLVIGLSAREATGSGVGAALDAATPVTVAYVIFVGAVALVANWLARRSVREIQELRIERTARSAALGRNREARRMISRADQLGRGEQRRFLEHLWSVATADLARANYLEGVVEYDEEAFAAVRREIEAAETALQAWVVTTAQSHQAYA